MRRLAFLPLLLAACAPAHLATLPTSGQRDLPEVFLGGWDGKRLGVYDDTTVEPGVTRRDELVKALRALSGNYGVVWIEKARLDAGFAAKHGLFCETSLCVAVLDRRDRGGSVDEWGAALVIFELGGNEGTVVQGIWLAGRAVRPPGPTKWPMFCRRRDDQPRRIHPDGGALFPERVAGAESFALFGEPELASQYRAGFTAPSETLCDEELVKAQAEPAPERPDIKGDPRLLGTEAK